MIRKKRISFVPVLLFLLVLGAAFFTRGGEETVRAAIRTVTVREETARAAATRDAMVRAAAIRTVTAREAAVIRTATARTEGAREETTVVLPWISLQHR